MEEVGGPITRIKHQTNYKGRIRPYVVLHVIKKVIKLLSSQRVLDFAIIAIGRDIFLETDGHQEQEVLSSTMIVIHALLLMVAFIKWMVMMSLHPQT